MTASRPFWFWGYFYALFQIANKYTADMAGGDFHFRSIFMPRNRRKPMKRWEAQLARYPP